MKLICESCQTRYSISDEKVRGKNKVFKIKCRSCGETIVVKGTDPDAPAAEAEDDATTVAPAPSGMEPDEALDDGWYVVLAGEQVGPLAKAAVLQHLAQGALDATSFVWRQGYEDWKKLSEVEGLSHLVAIAPVAASAEDDATMMDDQLPDNVRALFEAERASRASKAAVPDSSDDPTMAIGPGDDELAMTRMVPAGELESESASRAEAHHPVAQPHPAEAQPLRTSTGQMKARSLESFFGEEEPAAPQEEPGGFFGQEPKAADSGPMLYQRRETSVLFSLNEFKKDKTKDAPMAGLGADTKSPDSGLIDIRAVARKETKARQARQTAGDLFADFGGGPAETEAPVEMSTRLDTATAAPLLQRKPSRAPVWIGLAAVLVVGGAVGGYLYMNQDKGPAAPAPQAQAPAQPAPAGTQQPGEDPKEAAGDPKQADPAADPKQAEQVAQPPEPEKAPEVVAAADAGAHEEAASADAGATGEEVAKAEGTDEQGAVDPGEKQPERTPAEKAAAEKAAKELAAKKAAEAKKKAEEKAMAMKETPKAPVEQPKKDEKKVAVVAQNTQGNSATDLLNMVQTQQKKETPPTPPVAGGEGDSAQTKLSASVVRKVIREHQGKVVGCYRTHGGGGAGAVTINTSITVGGDGGVRSARVTTGEFSGNAVGSCIVAALRGMSFPRFASDSQTISIPFRVQ